MKFYLRLQVIAMRWVGGIMQRVDVDVPQVDPSGIDIQWSLYLEISLLLE